MSTAAQIADVADFVGRQWAERPRVGIVLGTGLDALADQVNASLEMGFEQIPHFQPTTALGHSGRLLCGTILGINVMMIEGRLHAYEGYSHAQIVLPIRVMQAMGIEVLILSNASGGVHPRLSSGDLVVVQDHVNLMRGHPLIGSDRGRLATRWTDMSAPYDPGLIRQAQETARQCGFDAHAGVYAAMTGPTYETRAEYRFLRKIGVDVVGMSTVPEVIVAADAGIRVLALSAVTNVCRPDSLSPTDAHQVIAAAESTAPKMRDIVSGMLAQMAGERSES